MHAETPRCASYVQNAKILKTKFSIGAVGSSLSSLVGSGRSFKESRSCKLGLGKFVRVALVETLVASAFNLNTPINFETQKAGKELQLFT
jgi:hypothetical protein